MAKYSEKRGWRKLRVVVEVNCKDPDYNTKDLAWDVKRMLGGMKFVQQYCDHNLSREGADITFPKVKQYNRHIAATE